MNSKIRYFIFGLMTWLLIISIIFLFTVYSFGQVSGCKQGLSAFSGYVNVGSCNVPSNPLTVTGNGFIDPVKIIGLQTSTLGTMTHGLYIDINGVVKKVPIVNLSTTNNISFTSVLNTLSITDASGTLTTNAVNSVSNTSVANTLLTTVNGVAGGTVPIINTNSLAYNGANGNLTSTVNGVVSASVNIPTHAPFTLTSSASPFSFNVTTQTANIPSAALLTNNGNATFDFGRGDGSAIQTVDCRVTTVLDNGNGTATVTDDFGNDINCRTKETLTTLSLKGNDLEYIDEAGTTNTVTLPAAGWELTGNSGTDSGVTNWIGTNDAADLVIRVNGAEIGHLGQLNNVCFGDVDGGNSASGQYSTVSGGSGNNAIGSNSTVSGGKRNTTTGDNSTSSGGTSNRANGKYSTVSGGEANTASSKYSTISGGEANVANNESSTVSGGSNNTAEGKYSTVSGGSSNTAFSYGEWVGGLFSKNYTPNSATTWHENDYIFRLGNGQNASVTSDAMKIKKNGDVFLPSYISAPLLGTDANGKIISVTAPVGLDITDDPWANNTGAAIVELIATSTGAARSLNTQVQITDDGRLSVGINASSDNKLACLQTGLVEPLSRSGYFVNNSTGTSAGNQKYGIVGICSGSNTGATSRNYGVRGEASGGTNNYSGSFVGMNFQVVNSANSITTSSIVNADVTGSSARSMLIIGKKEVASGDGFGYLLYSNDGATATASGLQSPNSLSLISAGSNGLDLGSNNGDVKFYAQTGLNSSPFQRMIIKASSGDVGINTVTPAFKFDVNGTARIGTTPIITTATKMLVKDATTGQICEQNLSAGSVNKYDEFIATAAQKVFTLTNTPNTNSDVVMFRNGVSQGKTTYTVTRTTVTYTGAVIAASDRINFQYTK